jgi:hypothetical protein
MSNVTREARQARGVCDRCGRHPPVPGRRACVACARLHAAQLRATRAARRADPGLGLAADTAALIARTTGLTRRLDGRIPHLDPGRLRSVLDTLRFELALAAAPFTTPASSDATTEEKHP